MSMKRVQVQFDENDYQTIKKIGFIENRAISDIIREATKTYLKSKTDPDNKLQEIFATDAEVEKELNESIEDFYEVYEELSK